MREATITVRVTPRAARDAIAGWQDGVLRVRLSAPPVDGRANEALLRFLAAHLGLPVRTLRIVAGATARVKRIRITGMAEDELLARLAAPTARSATTPGPSVDAAHP